jgi:hypothetical protein
MNPAPKLAMVATIDAPDASAIPTFGDPNAFGKLLSGGPAPGVVMPVPIRKVEPEYLKEARKARASGTVVVCCEVGPDRRPVTVPASIEVAFHLL